MNNELLHRADISSRIETTPTLEGRYEGILDDISHQTGFTPETVIGKSTWWGKKVGAVLYEGTYPLPNQSDQQTPAILKIEAVNMLPGEITESAMIHHAQKALVGSGLRPPHLYKELPWTSAHGGYSALIMERVPTSHPVLPLNGTKEQMEQLLEIRQRYHQAFARNNTTPWVALDSDRGTYLSRYTKEKFDSWRKTRHEHFAKSPFIKDGDEELIQQAVEVLTTEYQGVQPEFQQGHFSHRDVVHDKEDIVMFSNLYWSYRVPFYDVAFASHWYLYEPVSVPGMTIERLKEQYALWEEVYASFADTLTTEEKKLFLLARLERLAAGLNLDALSSSNDPSNTLAGYVVEKTRQDLQTTLTQLKR